MTASFDLTSEPWVPCLRLDGTRVEFGLKEVFARAHEVRALVDSSPLVTASLHRLLLAIVHRCFGPPTLAAWAALWQQKRFDTSVTDAYLDKWRHRFDLLHPERPFYQVRGLAYEPKPASELVLETSNYGASVHLFEHRPRGDDGHLTLAQAARALVATQAYKPGGLTTRAKGEPSSAGAAPLNARAISLVTGDTLWETLLLNCLKYDPVSGAPIPAGKVDVPAWESERTPVPGRREVAGWLDLLTWQSRRIELRPAPAGAGVIEVVVAGGDDLPPDVLDPQVAWRADPKAGLLAHRLRQDRAVWRDSETLLVGNAGGSDHRPRIFSQLASLELDEVIPSTRRFGLEVIGLVGDQAKILLVRQETLPISRRLLATESAWAAVREAVEHLGAVGKALEGAVWTAARRLLSPGDRDPDAKDLRNLTDSMATTEAYWARLAVPFQAFLLDLGAAREGVPLAGLLKVAVRAARDALDHSVDGFGDGARALQAASLGRDVLEKRLASLNEEKT
ncbi:MAG: type I-E CRISPR-associated protein Cse1/CasA [Deltaproteobacteria bacterium]|nr:type I-E CRISPR-associated protein Cse1/CasA [Deltaproteobacteria bacterium]